MRRMRNAVGIPVKMATALLMACLVEVRKKKTFIEKKKSNGLAQNYQMKIRKSSYLPRFFFSKSWNPCENGDCIADGVFGRGKKMLSVSSLNLNKFR